MSVKIDYSLIKLAKLSEEHFSDLANFDCGDEEMNRFLKEEAYNEQEMGMNTTTFLYYDNVLAAFCSICNDSVLLHKDEKEELPYANVPAIKIARLGRDKRFRNYQLGRFLIDYVVWVALKIDKEMCGVRLITLDAYPERVKYYQDYGFVINQHDNYKRRKSPNISMRYDIYKNNSKS